METGGQFTHILEKKDLESFSLLSSSEFKLATNETFGYDLPCEKLRITGIKYHSFLN